MYIKHRSVYLLSRKNPSSSPPCLFSASVLYLHREDFTFIFHFHALEKEMATHSSVPAWRTPGTGDPGGPPSMGSHRVGHDRSDLAAAAATGNKLGVGLVYIGCVQGR